MTCNCVECVGWKYEQGDEQMSIKTKHENADSYVDMVRCLAKPGSDILRDLTPEMAHLWHMGSAMLGECAELMEGICGGSKENIVEEMGDIEFYLEGLRNRLGIERWETIPENFHPYHVGFQGIVDVVINAGKVFDVLKKACIYAKPLIMSNLIVSLIALEESLEYLRREHGVERSEILAANCMKLGKRYADGKFSNAQAQARADKNGAE